MVRFSLSEWKNAHYFIYMYFTLQELRVPVPSFTQTSLTFNPQNFCVSQNNWIWERIFIYILISSASFKAYCFGERILQFLQMMPHNYYCRRLRKGYEFRPRPENGKRWQQQEKQTTKHQGWFFKNREVLSLLTCCPLLDSFVVVLEALSLKIFSCEWKTFSVTCDSPRLILGWRIIRVTSDINFLSVDSSPYHSFFYPFTRLFFIPFLSSHTGFSCCIQCIDQRNDRFVKWLLINHKVKKQLSAFSKVANIRETIRCFTRGQLVKKQ